MNDTGLMRMVHDAARHAAARHAHIARNIANADTPGYRATDLDSFAATLDAPGLDLRRTRAGHLTDTGPLGGARAIERDIQAAPNGNTVSLEHEVMQATRVEQDHETALSIYAGARDVLRAALGRK